MAMAEVGETFEVEVTGFAHGGLGVARHDGQVVFVAGGLPGEKVQVIVTELGSGGRFVRSDATAVRAASPHRVEPPCQYSAPGGCGGCDLQHAALGYQRELKAAVLAEQFARLTRREISVPVQELPGAQPDGLGTRTRVEFAVSAQGRAGLRRARSHELVEIECCLLGVPGAQGEDVLDRTWRDTTAVDVIVPSVGPRTVVPTPVAAAAPVVTERVEIDGRSLDFHVSARGFWQVHPGAPPAFVASVLRMLNPQPGDRVLDLYAGVGLFAAFLADAVTPLGQVIAVESDADACRHARGNLAAYRNALVIQGRVDDLFGVPRPKRRGAAGQRTSRPRKLRRSPLLPESADLVVLDPPRSGAGQSVCRVIAGLRPRAIAYVACDPAALARDAAYLLDQGYELGEVQAFDAFPMTHHFETIALFTRRA